MPFNQNKPIPDKENPDHSWLNLSDSEKSSILYLLPELKTKEAKKYKDLLFNTINHERQLENISPTSKKILSKSKVQDELGMIKSDLISAKYRINNLSKNKDADHRLNTYYCIANGNKDITKTKKAENYFYYVENDTNSSRKTIYKTPLLKETLPGNDRPEDDFPNYRNEYYDIYRETLDKLMAGIDLYLDNIITNKGRDKSFEHCFLIISIAEIFELEDFPYPFKPSPDTKFFSLIASITKISNPRRLIENAINHRHDLKPNPYEYLKD